MSGATNEVNETNTTFALTAVEVGENDVYWQQQTLEEMEPYR
jgi:hypothetical protein